MRVLTLLRKYSQLHRASSQSFGNFSEGYRIWLAACVEYNTERLVAHKICSLLDLRCFVQCTPQELAVLLTAFNKIGKAFDPVEERDQAGFKSSILNDILSTLPKLRQPMEDVLSEIHLKSAKEGKKDELWIDQDKYPEIMGLQVVRIAKLDRLWMVNFGFRRSRSQSLRLWTNFVKVSLKSFPFQRRSNVSSP